MPKLVLIVEFEPMGLLEIAGGAVAAQFHFDVVVEFAVVEYRCSSARLTVDGALLGRINKQMDDRQDARHVGRVDNGSQIFRSACGIGEKGPAGSVSVVVGRHKVPANHLPICGSAGRNGGAENSVTRSTVPVRPIVK